MCNPTVLNSYQLLCYGTWLVMISERTAYKNKDHIAVVLDKIYPDGTVPREPFYASSYIATPVPCECCPSKVVIQQYCGCRDETSTVSIPLRNYENWEYQPERTKTFLTVFCFCIVMLINHFVLAVISDIISRLPVPDLAHSLIPQYDIPRHLADVFASAACVVLFLLCSVFHKYRWIITRRFFYIGTVLYIMRAISICLTHIPSGFHDYENDICVPPNPSPNPSLFSVITKFFSIMVTFGLQVQMTENKLHCGDMLFSGHTTIISTSCFFLNYYTPHSLWPLKLVAVSLCIVAMFCVVISRIHYSVDVVMGYWISSIIFSVYHGFCEVPHILRPRNRSFRRLFLFWTMFELERNVPEGRIPNRLEWPLPWPKAIADRFEEWNEQSTDTAAGRMARWLSDHRIRLHF